MDDGPEVHFFGGKQRKSLRQIEAQLLAENAQRAGAGAVFLAHPTLKNMIEKIKIRLHGVAPGLAEFRSLRQRLTRRCAGGGE
jgi:hypothetical protein